MLSICLQASSCWTCCWEAIAAGIVFGAFVGVMALAVVHMGRHRD